MIEYFTAKMALLVSIKETKKHIDTLPLLLSSCLHTSAKQNTIEAETLGDSCQMAAIFHSRLKLFSLEKKTSEKNRRRSCRHRVTGAAHTAALGGAAAATSAVYSVVVVTLAMYVM